jgi:hypothetical protein
MSVDLAGAGPSKLQLGPTTLGLSYPFAIFVWMLPDNTSTNMMVAGVGDDGGAAEAMIYAEGAASGKVRAFTREPSTGPNSTTSIAAAWTPALAVFTSASSRTIYYGAGASVTDTATLTDNVPALVDRIVVGVRGIDDNSLPYSGLVAHFAIWSGGTALGSTEWAALAGGALPSSVSSGTLYDYWALTTATATHTGVNGRVLTAFNTTTGASDPAAGIGFAAGARLGLTIAAGTMQAIASGFAAGAALRPIVAGGALGPQPGVLTSQPLRTNNGTLLASVALDYVDVYLEASGVFVGRFTGLSTNGDGVFMVTSALLTPGTAYKLDWRAAAGQRRMPVATAA